MKNVLRSFIANRRHSIAAKPATPEAFQGKDTLHAIFAGVVSLVAILTGALLFASLALAAEAPHWQQPPVTRILHSTRVIIGINLENGELATKWETEYAPAEADGQEPPEGSPAWRTANSGETTAAGAANDIYIGAIDPGEGDSLPTQLRGLTPSTLYYAHFVAKNNEGEAIEKISFRTLPVEKPEIPKRGTTEEGPLAFALTEDTDATGGFEAKVETNGAQTTYSFEYATSENGTWMPFTSGATGTITATQEYARVEAHLDDLTPEATYYVRVRASNEKGGIEPTQSFMTGTARVVAGALQIRNVTAESAHLTGYVIPHGSQTEWHFEYATSESGIWGPVPGGSGTVSQSEAEAVPYPDQVSFGGGLTGLKPSTIYYVRVSAENKCAVGCGSVRGPIERFESSGAPTETTTFAIHAIHGESLRMLGGVNPNSVPTSAEQVVTVSGAPSGGTFTLTFEKNTTNVIAYDASAETVRQELEGLPLPGRPMVEVDGPNGGPYDVAFRGSDGEMGQPLIEENASGLMPSGTVTVVSTQEGGVAYDTHYHFEYVSQKQFEREGFTKAFLTSEINAGTGDTLQIVGADMYGVEAGESYRYRVSVTNTSPGDPVIPGSEQSFTVPALIVPGSEGPCPNEAFRNGLSARLPDCRAYEQVTPVDKEGAQEPFHYSFGIVSAVVVGEDGDHVALESPDVSYGSGATAGQSPYFFSREEGQDWRMIAGAPQPETGLDSIEPQVYNADLSQVAAEFKYSPSAHSESPEVEYKVGPAGGPYTKVASVPRQHPAQKREGWVTATGNFSKLILQSEDHSLLGGSTGTKSGFDIYEYTSQAGLNQINVSTSGSTIGSCGSRIAHGEEEGAQEHAVSGPDSVSADGSRVFFEAVPGSNCSLPSSLYMRVNGGESDAETVDIGAYKFIAANAQGTKLLLDKDSGGELVGYDLETAKVESQSSAELAAEQELSILGIPVHPEPGGEGSGVFSTPRYTYFKGVVPGIPGGGTVEAGPNKGEVAKQIYRYDSVEKVLECVSCASSSDPEPKQPAFLDGIDGLPFVNGGLPDYTAVSANGDFAFFTTPAALVPQDIDGETPVEVNEEIGGSGEFVDIGNTTSPSSDVYEWRKGGVDGCGQVQGCLSLITDGEGGYINLLLGTADEGRDVFIYTRSKLVPGDNDTSGDIYDARIDGGLAEPAQRPVECEADACSTPPSPPNDVTPSSSTFGGVGNVIPTPSKPTVKSGKKSKPKKNKPKKKNKKRAGKKSKKKPGKASGGRIKVRKSVGGLK